VRRILFLVIGEYPRAHSVERVEPADRLELVLQIADHEADQPLGFAALVAGRVARADGGDRQRAGDRHSGEACRREIAETAVSASALALDEFVETDSEHSGDELEKADPASLALTAQIRREGLRALGRRPASAVVFVFERGRETFLVFAALDVAGEGLA